MTQIVRLDHILLHNFDRARRLFITATKTIIRDEYDPILGAGYRRGSLRNERLIVGLPAIHARHPYIVMVEPDGAADMVKLGSDAATEFIWAERTLVWL